MDGHDDGAATLAETGCREQQVGQVHMYIRSMYRIAGNFGG